MSSIKKNLFYSFFLSFSQVLLPFITIPYISRVLDPEGVGRVGFIDSFAYYFIAIAEFGITVYGTREVVKCLNDKQALRRLVSELVVLHLISSAIAIVLYAIAVFFVWHKINDIRLLLFSVSFLLVNAFACEWYFMGTERFRYITIRSLVTRLLGLASVFVLIKQPSDYYLYYVIMVLAASANLVWNMFSLFREVPLQLKGIDWKRHVKYTWVTYVISLLYSATIMLDNVLVGLASTAATVAFYSFAVKIARVSGILLSDSLQVFFPKIVSLIKEEKTEQVQALLMRNVQFIVFFAVPLCAGIFILSDEVVATYLGKSFSGVSFNLKIVAAFPFIKLFSLFITRQVLVASHNEKFSVISLTTGVVTLLIAMPLLSFYFASPGGCIAIMLTELVILAMNCYFARKINASLRIFDVPGFLKACIAVLVFVPIVFVLRKYTGGVVFLASAVITCFIAYILVQLFVLRTSFALYLNTAILQYLFKRKLQ